LSPAAPVVVFVELSYSFPVKSFADVPITDAGVDTLAFLEASEGLLGLFGASVLRFLGINTFIDLIQIATAGLNTSNTQICWVLLLSRPFSPISRVTSS